MPLGSQDKSTNRRLYWSKIPEIVILVLDWWVWTSIFHRFRCYISSLSISTFYHTVFVVYYHPSPFFDKYFGPTPPWCVVLETYFVGFNSLRSFVFQIPNFQIHCSVVTSSAVLYIDTVDRHKYILWLITLLTFDFFILSFVFPIKIVSFSLILLSSFWLVVFILYIDVLGADQSWGLPPTSPNTDVIPKVSHYISKETNQTHFPI